MFNLLFSTAALLCYKFRLISAFAFCSFWFVCICLFDLCLFVWFSVLLFITFIIVPSPPRGARAIGVVLSAPALFPSWSKPVLKLELCLALAS